MSKITVSSEEHNIRLDIWLSQQCPDFSRSQIKKLIETQQVRVNGRITDKAGTKCQSGDTIEFELPELPDSKSPKAEIGIDYRTVYEDDHLIVIDKPAGLVVHPGAGHTGGTLINALLARYPEISAVGESERPGIVHRLDAETSGLLLIARTQTAYEKLVQMFAVHAIQRQYWAICYAPKLPDSGRFDTPYGRHPTQRIKYSSRFDAPKRAITNCRVIQRNDRGFALVTCLLETGRTHQIRVHLSEHQAPILGDSLYSPAPYAKTKIIPRLALHAQRLRFIHPVTGESCDFQSPFPNDFIQALNKLQLSVPEITE